MSAGSTLASLEAREEELARQLARVKSLVRAVDGVAPERRSGAHLARLVRRLRTRPARGVDAIATAPVRRERAAKAARAMVLVSMALMTLAAVVALVVAWPM